ncbi:c-type cytochrome [Roseovarius sp. S1116L3]|uniref:c-type cytochrome n=1 Tax=Roseovarius roseus TaxID=3342636 RepID=UPI003728B368
MRGSAILATMAVLSAAPAPADPAHDLFTGQDTSAADGRLALFACHNCHGRDGRGGIEGDVPEIAGTALLEPTDLRPAYDADSFRDALVSGVDPAGRSLSRIMPRFDLTEAELALLWAYLQDLPRRQALGVEPGRVQVGIVINPARPELGLRYLRKFRDETDRIFASSTIFGRKVEIVPLSDPAAQADEMIAALAMPPSLGGLTEQLTALGLPVLFPLAGLKGREDASIQRAFVPTDRDVNGAIAYHLASTTAQRIAISADPARAEALSYMIRLEMPQADVWRLETLPADTQGTLDALIDLGGDLPENLPTPAILYQLASQPTRAVAAQQKFLVIEAPDLINLAIDEGLHPLEAHAVLAARILAASLTEAGRDLTRSRLLSLLGRADLASENLDYARLPLSGTAHVSILEDRGAEPQ